MQLPLPNHLRRLLDGQQPTANDNLGLWLDKLVPVDEQTWQLAARARDVTLRRMFCGRTWQSKATAESIARMAEACERVYGSQAWRHFVVKTQDRLLVGYGRASALESSVSVHPVLGCPRIPGSALKGLLRSWLRDVPNPKLSVEELLGAPDAAMKDDVADPRRGRLVFHDALPEDGKFQLAVDVLTPHAGEHYEATQPPADWLSPVPFTFLTVVETRFRVFMGLLPKGSGCPSDRSEQPDEHEYLGEVRKALCDALEIEGIGAKRAAGYGRLRRV